MTIDPELQRQRQEWREQEEYEEKNWRELQEENRWEYEQESLKMIEKHEKRDSRGKSDEDGPKIKPEDLPF